MNISFNLTTIQDSGLSITEFLILMYLEQEKFTCKKISTSLNISDRTTGRLVAQLVKNGYLINPAKTKYEITDKLYESIKK